MALLYGTDESPRRSIEKRYYFGKVCPDAIPLMRRAASCKQVISFKEVPDIRGELQLL